MQLRSHVSQIYNHQKLPIDHIFFTDFERDRGGGHGVRDPCEDISCCEYTSIGEYTSIEQSTELVSLYIGYWTLNNYYYYYN